jgi:hypothetical protein
VGLETALAVSALLDVDAFRPAADAFRPAVDAFRPVPDAFRPAVDTLRAAVDVLRLAVDAPRIAVPWNNTTYQHTYRAPLCITIQITIQGDLKVHM